MPCCTILIHKDIWRVKKGFLEVVRSLCVSVNCKLIMAYNHKSHYKYSKIRRYLLYTHNFPIINFDTTTKVHVIQYKLPKSSLNYTFEGNLLVCKSVRESITT